MEPVCFDRLILMMKEWQKKGIFIEGSYLNIKEISEICKGAGQYPALPPWKKKVYCFLNEWMGDDDFIIQTTSGTTGKPKQLRLSKTAMMASAAKTIDFFELGEKQTALLCLPADYIAGKMMMVRSIVSGMHLEITEPLSNPVMPDIQQIDFCAMVPLQVMNYIESYKTPGQIKKLIIGGAATGTSLENRLLKFPAEAYSTYGMAETCSHIAIRKLNGENRQDRFHVLKGIRISADERNCLVIDADFLSASVQTHDIVSITGEDTFKWLGRFDNLINSAGVKIVPEEVEASCYQLLSIECAVTGLPDEILGQKVVYIFEIDFLKKTDMPELVKKLNGLQTKFWKPKEVYAVEKFPRNASFKIDRHKLREMIINQNPLKI